MSTDFIQWSSKHRTLFEKTLHSVFDNSSNLSTACAYPLQTGGKRIRPLLLFAAHEALGQAVSLTAINVAVSVELIHTYSLVHDDLPCMDDDDYRRGQPTVHKKYDVPSALLVGDALLTKAFYNLSAVDATILPRLLKVLGQASGHLGMIGGQSMDIGFEGKIDSLEKLNILHQKKTGALITAAVKLGGITAGATDEQLQQLTIYGNSIGLAFQLADDILDEEEDSGHDGPPSYVKLIGKSQTRSQAKALCKRAIDAVAELPNPLFLTELAYFSINRKI